MVRGIGGFFFRARDPEALAAWYRRHFGIGGADDAPWEQAAGPTVFKPFAADNDYFSLDKQWMLNLRVSHIDTMIHALREAGVHVTTKADWDAAGLGRFAHVVDPEGNTIELWEPPAD